MVGSCVLPQTSAIKPLFLRLDKVFLTLNQVSRLEHHSLGFVKDVQVEHTCLGAGRLGLDAAQLIFDSIGNHLKEVVARGGVCV